MAFFQLKLLHEVIRGLAARHEESLVRNVLQAHLAIPLSQFREGLRLVENAGDVIQNAVEHRDTGIFGFEELILGLFETQIPVQRKHVEAGCHRIFSRDVLQLEHVLDHLNFLGLNGACPSPYIQHDLQLFFGHEGHSQTLSAGDLVDHRFQDPQQWPQGLLHSINWVSHPEADGDRVLGSQCFGYDIPEHQ